MPSFFKDLTKSPSIAQLRDRIVHHSYSLQLFAGTLPQQTFDLYLTQDYIYLYHYGKILQQLAQRLRVEGSYIHYAEKFELFAQATFEAQQDLKKTYLTHLNCPSLFGDRLPPLTSQFSNYIKSLEAAAESEPLAVVLTRLVPCFWSYTETGKALKSSANLNSNPYRSWIELQYCSPEFDAFTEDYINMIDELAEANIHSQQEMSLAFEESIRFEYEIYDSVVAANFNTINPPEITPTY